MRRIFFQCVFMLSVIFISSSCNKKNETGTPPYLPPPVQPVLLKEINIPGLPSPYYHFKYSITGQPIYASFASDLLLYDINYIGNRVTEMKCKVIVNKDRLQYSHNNAGQVDTIRYADSTGIVYKRVYLNYDGQKLSKAVRERRTGNDFIIEKAMSVSYYTDGNLRQLRDERYAISGQVENTYIDEFEQYDTKINADAFSLLHNEFFEHLFLLPGVQLQKNNPGKLIRTGDGVHYTIVYTYTYNDENLPLTKAGDAIITNGSGAGQRFQTNSNFSYY